MIEYIIGLLFGAFVMHFLKHKRNWCYDGRVEYYKGNLYEIKKKN